MLHASYCDRGPDDLAGPYLPQPPISQIQSRLQTLINRHLSFETLHERLRDLPVQFTHPHPRPWQAIDWQGIDARQISGVDPLVFLAILAGTTDTEEPIRGYTQASRQYLDPLYPQMARFVGGRVDANGTLVELGLWEKEERQHAPALHKVYSQLTGLKLRTVPHIPRGYQPTGDPYVDLYQHGLHRVATEYGATCLYLWLMAHSTGPLQAVLAELLLDEINHMTKFLGFGLWAFPDSSVLNVMGTLTRTAIQKLWRREQHSSLIHTLRRMTQVLHWQAWSFNNKATFLWTFALVLHRLWDWSRRLTPEMLADLFGKRPARSPLIGLPMAQPNLAATSHLHTCG